MPAAVLAMVALVEFDMADKLTLAGTIGLFGVVALGGTFGTIAALMAVNEEIHWDT